MNGIFGAPQNTLEVVDLSALPVPTLKGVVLVWGPTLLGKHATPTLVRNWDEFKREFGGLTTTTDFPFLCKRALDGGAKLIVCRVGHYTDITDAATLAGTKASATAAEAGVGSVVVEAKSVGAGYNGIQVIFTPAKSAKADHVDLRVKVAGLEDQFITDIPEVPSVAQKNALNDMLKHVSLGAITTQLPTSATATLASGAEVVANIVDTDYTGDQDAKTGIYAFDAERRAFRIANIARTTYAVDNAMRNYAESRKDLRFIIVKSVQSKADAEAIQGYLQATGSHASNTAFNTWYGTAVLCPNITVSDPDNVGATRSIACFGDVLACIARKDNKETWLSAAQDNEENDFARIYNQNGISFDLLSPALKTLWDSLYEEGFNAVGNKETGNVGLEGNRSLFRDRSKILSKENVADLVFDIARNFKVIIAEQSFRPNDLPFFRKTFLKLKPHIEAYQTKGAIYQGKARFFGDQYAKSVDELQVNTKEDLSAGKWKWKFAFAPVPATEYIEGFVTPSDLVTIEGILRGNNQEFNVI